MLGQSDGVIRGGLWGLMGAYGVLPGLTGSYRVLQAIRRLKGPAEEGPDAQTGAHRDTVGWFSPLLRVRRKDNKTARPQ